jgi:hypothetical protein
MEDDNEEKVEFINPENVDILPSLREYIVRVCVAIINKNSLDAIKLNEALDREDAVGVLTRFISSAESSIVFIEDATSLGGEGMKSLHISIDIS